ncbi:hypothetical protein EDD91_5196 [Streptomyces sp. KS 21]|nr:hypothetical protein EDD91_5196 [Streptomyces sp. KS 21]
MKRPASETFGRSVLYLFICTRPHGCVDAVRAPPSRSDPRNTPGLSVSMASCPTD